MKPSIVIVAFSVVVLISACDIHVEPYDYVAPAPPQGVVALAGDNMVTLTWLPNNEPDLAGYKIYVSGTYSGRYDLIGTTRSTRFTDRDVINGETYYYAVTAFDLNGNESDLSRDVVYATPLPEGYGVILYDYHTYPNRAGYDFSTNTVGQYDDQYTDVFFDNDHGVLYLDVWKDTDIQDMGYTRSLDEILHAPTTGWSPTKDAQAILGHTYVIHTWDGHYAKLRIVGISATRVEFDWAYQFVQNDPDLKTQQRNTLTRVWDREH